MKPPDHSGSRLSRIRSATPAGLAGLVAVGLGYLIGGKAGILIAAAVWLAVNLRLGAVAGLVGVGLLVTGAVATLVEADLTASLAFARDRTTAARAVQLGVTVVTAAVIATTPAEIRQQPSSSTSRTNGLKRSGDTRLLVPITLVLVALSVTGWLLFGPDRHTAFNDLIERLDNGIGLPESMAGQPVEAVSAVLPVTLSAFGPPSFALLGGLGLAAALVGFGLGEYRDGGLRRAAIVGSVTAITAVWPGSSTPAALALGCLGLAWWALAGGSVVGDVGAGLAVGAAILSAPEAAVVAPALIVAAIWARRSAGPLLCGLGAALVSVTWFRWASANLDQDLSEAVDAGTVLRLGLPILVLLAAHSWRRGRPRPSAKRAGTLTAAFLLAATSCATSPTTDGDAAGAAARPTVEPASTEEPAPTPAPTASLPTPAAPAQPNVVVFLTDDQTVEQMWVMTRTSALLAEHGATFTQSFVNVPVCCPSRATLLTGQHASNHGVLTNSGTNGGFESFTDQDATLATGLEDAGYYTLFVGKYLNGYGLTADQRYVPLGWSDYRALVAPTDILYTEPSFIENGILTSYGEDDYVTDVITDHALDGIDQAVAEEQPFFALIAYPAPHGQGGVPLDEYDPATFFDEVGRRYPNIFLAPPVPAPRHAGTLSTPMPRGPAFNEEDVSDKPPFLRRTQFEAELEAQMEAYYQAGVESLLAVDESIAAIAERINDNGLTNETYFVFTSDNGLLLGQHRFYGVKYLPYEASVRVPLIIRGPDVVERSSVSAVVSNVDLAATIFEATGVPPNRSGDGRSLLGVMSGAEPPWGRAVLLEGFELRASSPPYVGVHTGDSVYVEWETGAIELYDLTVDPDQLENLAGLPQAAELEARNRRLLRELEACTGADCGRVGAELAPPAR